MRNRQSKIAEVEKDLTYYGADILASEGFKSSDKNIQHGSVSVMDHSISVSMMCIRLARMSHLKLDYSSLIRGSLLHDYFLYDWHNYEGHLHGYRHADRALVNASKDFAINPKEAYMITRHMFPLNIRPPKSREAVILCLADKICATKEIFSKPFYYNRIQEIKK